MGGSIEAIFMTDNQTAEEQAKGSWLFFSSVPYLRYLPTYIDMKGLKKLLPELMTFKDFLCREKEAIKDTYLS